MNNVCILYTSTDAIMRSLKKESKIIMKQLTPKHLLAEMIEHARLDNFIQGTWLKNGKGCMWGCTMQTSHFAIKEASKKYQVALWLTYLSEAIFEGLSTEDSKAWPVDCIQAFADYKGDPEIIKHRAAILRLTPLAKNNPGVADAINGVIDCHKQALKGDVNINWKAAALAADLAAVMSAEISAASSARPAAMSAERSAASSAEWSATTPATWKLEADNLILAMSDKWDESL